MELSSTELFVEILISGILYTFAISPILILMSPAADRTPGILPGLLTWHDWKPWVILAVAIVYAIGVGGNRLVEELYSAIACAFGVKSEKAAEWALRIDSEIARGWVERHKTYIKILRAASFSSLLFLICMNVYRHYSPKRQQPHRYERRHRVAALALFAFFSVALVAESWHYRDDLRRHHVKPEVIGP
ncbi:MAG TPA: hypothetical protein VLT89_07745 [Usitatibacter sp.]|nr:hypothetical protein [Usitatibacter sp.]